MSMKMKATVSMARDILLGDYCPKPVKSVTFMTSWTDGGLFLSYFSWSWYTEVAHKDLSRPSERS